MRIIKIKTNIFNFFRKKFLLIYNLIINMKIIILINEFILSVIKRFNLN